MPDDGQVVGNEQVGQVERLTQVRQQIEDLCLDGDVERGDGFVADQETRLHREGAGDADTLALPAAELVRIAACVKVVQAHHLQQFADPGADLGTREDVMHQQDLPQCGTHGHARVQRRERILEHDLHAFAQAAQAGPSDARDVLSLEEHAAIRGGQKLQQHARKRAFSAAGFSDQSQHFPASDAEGHAEHASPHGEPLPEILHFENRGIHPDKIANIRVP